MKLKVSSLKRLVKLISSKTDKKRKDKVTNIKNETGAIITDLADIKRIIREYNEQL